MGGLNLPVGGTVCVDAQILVYTVETHPLYFDLLRPLWQASESGSVVVGTSHLTRLEVLVRPMRDGDEELVGAYQHVLDRSVLTLWPIDAPILQRAAELRARHHGLRTPDAIHAATAMETGCAAFVTNDSAFRRVAELPVLLLADALSSA